MKALFMFLILSLTSSIYGQQSISSSGSDATGSGGSVSYTFGQAVYTTKTGITGSVAQGVQQPFEISVITAIDDAKGISLIAYPNPVTDFLTLKVADYSEGKLSYWLYDIKGNLLQNKKADGMETRVSMQSLSSGTYILRITDNDKIVKTFKIIKY